MNTLKTLRIAVAFAAMGLASASAHAGFSASLNFDNVASGATANSSLGSLISYFHFANADTVLDEDANGYTGTFHWVDATATYGEVLAKNDGTAVSASNVLWNDHQPILLVLNQATDIASFSIQQDLSGFGNLQTNGNYLSFLDETGHEIAGANIAYTQGGNPGLFISSIGTVYHVSAILLSAGVSYDNLTITAVPEPESYAMMLAGLGLLGFAARRRNQAV